METDRLTAAGFFFSIGLDLIPAALGTTGFLFVLLGDLDGVRALSLPYTVKSMSLKVKSILRFYKETMVNLGT